MNTSMLTVMILSSVLADRREPSWQSDYFEAQKYCTAQKMPMALVFGAGPSGWNKIAVDGKLESATANLLANHYVCVFVDTTKESGRVLARTFEIERGVGMVLSDRTGTTQAFWHAGQLSGPSMTRYLQKYADEKVVVQTTETAPRVRTSFYPSSSTRIVTGFAPSIAECTS